jgi:hypothetical protein
MWDKFDPAHQCPKPTSVELHAMQTESMLDTLPDEVLQMVEMQDIAQAEKLSLSIHALDGTNGAETLQMLALVGNQVLLILMNLGSSSSFINANMLSRIVPQLSWWCQF